MKKIKFVLAGFIIVTLFSGCLQVDTKVNLNQDGSGTIEETVVMKTEFINMMKEFAAIFDSAKIDEFNVFNEDRLKSRVGDFGEGVKYVSGENYSIPGYEGFKALYTFTDINKIRINPSPEDKVPFGEDSEESDETSVNNDFFLFKFSKGNPATLVVEFPKSENENNSSSEDTSEYEDSTFSDQNLEKLTDMFDGLKISTVLNFNSSIKETDASFIDGNTITLLRVDFSEIIKNKEVMKNLEKKKPETMEEFKAAIGDLEGIKIEFKDKITTKF
ncbi:MAG: hypothetical protein RBR74_10740 [Ignavibacteriaceae bacterium]|jgi:hypothetical protein|nr:hypothetical protein [Ignavibacteriaceae bacterium]